MMTDFVSKTPVKIIEKLDRLLMTLQRAKKNFEQAASTVSNTQLRFSILGLAQETKQYVNELMSHIEILGGRTGKSNGEFEFNYDGLSGMRESEMKEEKNRLEACTNSEKLIVQLYREILNEPFLYESIRKMMRYQLNGMLHYFSQVKLLNASLQKD